MLVEPERIEPERGATGDKRLLQRLPLKRYSVVQDPTVRRERHGGVVVDRWCPVDVREEEPPHRVILRELLDRRRVQRIGLLKVHADKVILERHPDETAALPRPFGMLPPLVARHDVESTFIPVHHQQ